MPVWLGSQNVVDLLNISLMLKTFLSQSSKIGNGSLALNGCYEAMGLCRWKPGPIFCVWELHFNVVVGNEQGLPRHFLSSSRSAMVTVDDLVCSFLPPSDAWLFIMPPLQLPDTNSVPTIQLISDSLPGAKGLVLQRSLPMLVAGPQPPDF